MWSLSFSIFVGLKWLTWWKARKLVAHPAWRSAAYLLAWPGMDAEAFLDPRQHGSPPAAASWVWAATETILGATLLWAGVRTVARWPLFCGWVGMLGLIFILHFGTFHLIALCWQSVGVRVEPIMAAPLRSTSLAEFWGRRWNLGFRQFAHDLIFAPLHRKIGVAAAGFAVFAFSGVIHDLVISLPARAGYGLPTLYFLLQGAGVLAERSRLGKSLGLGRGFSGWCFMLIILTAPMFGLFHTWFVLRVILPFMMAIHAL